MSNVYNANAPKKATNLSINSDLLAKSRSLNINLSATLEQALGAALARAETGKWQQDNKNAIRSYNQAIDEHGCFGDEFREF